MTDQNTPGGERPRDFFDWVRGLGIVRDHGWIGGVCGGLGARTGLDPLIVRGVAIVVAILGGPILFVYALGWALLPDREGRILVQQLIRGVFEPALIAIGILVVLTFFPFMHGIWWQGVPTVWGMPGWLEVTLRVGWGIALTVAVVALVVWLASRPRGAAPTGGADDPGRTGSAGSSSPGDTATGDTDVGAGTAGTGGAPVGGPTASTQGFAASTPGTATHADWRNRMDERVRHTDEWGRRSSEKANRAVAEWRERLPGAGFVVITLGLALVSGAVAAGAVSGVFRGTAVWGDDSLVAGVVVATAVVAVGIIVAGVRGRSSGALGFFAWVGIVALAFTAIMPSGSRFVPVGSTHWSAEHLDSGDASYSMFVGDTTLDLGGLVERNAGGTVDVWLGVGRAEVVLPHDLPVRLEAHTAVGDADFPRGSTPRRVSGLFVGSARTFNEGRPGPVTTVRVWNLIGSIDVTEENAR